MTDWVPDYWLIITKRRFRWHWELRSLVGDCWASGKTRTFEAAKEAGQVRAKIGPTRYLPERPDPGIPERWPRVNYLPIKAGRGRPTPAETGAPPPRPTENPDRKCPISTDSVENDGGS